MNPFIPDPKKLARLKAKRRKMPKAQRAMFAAILAVVTLHFQVRLTEQLLGHRLSVESSPSVAMRVLR